MSIFESIFLGIIQGITESMPVSSTANMILAKKIFNIAECPEFQSFITFINIGTLCAVMIFYWGDCFKVLCGAWEFLRKDILPLKKQQIRSQLQEKMRQEISGDKKTFLEVLCATVPAVVILGCIRCVFNIDRSCTQYALFIGILSAMVLVFFDLFSKTSLKHIKSFSHAFVIGIVQVFALVPGMSRLGVCLIVMRLLGYSRETSLRFSFILSIPILAADIFYNMLIGNSVPSTEGFDTFFSLHLIPNIFAFIFGLISLKLVTLYIKNHTFLLFCLYKIVLFLYVFIVLI